MTITTRARLALFLSIAVLLRRRDRRRQLRGRGGPTRGPGRRSGSDGVAGIRVQPGAPESIDSGPPPFGDDCDDTIDQPVVVDPVPCVEEAEGTDPDTPVSSCPGDEDLARPTRATRPSRWSRGPG